MSNKDEDTTTAGSAGSAGTSRDAPKDEHQPAGSATDKPAVTSPGKPCKTPRLAERVTALRGQAIAQPRLTPKVRRKIAEHELLHDSDIPYEVFEKALRGMVCAQIERQDRANEALLLRINDLQYRMDDLEHELRVVTGKDPEG
ncbi:MAG: hypothetical protein PHT99_04160 [Methanoregula sp.]|nr:hypothetical protein [Methanoregula sp.]